MLPTMCRGSEAMVDGGGKGYCPKRIVVGSKKNEKCGDVDLSGVRTRQPTRIRA